MLEGLDDLGRGGAAGRFSGERLFHRQRPYGGVRGYAAGDPQPRPVRQGLFLAGMFDEIKPGITDFIHLPTPVWHLSLIHILIMPDSRIRPKKPMSFQTETSTTAGMA